jgi:hypothetical protein
MMQRDHLEGLCAGGNILLKRIIKKPCERVSTGIHVAQDSWRALVNTVAVLRVT